MELSSSLSSTQITDCSASSRILSNSSKTSWCSSSIASPSSPISLSMLAPSLVVVDNGSPFPSSSWTPNISNMSSSFRDSSGSFLFSLFSAILRVEEITVSSMISLLSVPATSPSSTITTTSSHFGDDEMGSVFTPSSGPTVPSVAVFLPPLSSDMVITFPLPPPTPIRSIPVKDWLSMIDAAPIDLAIVETAVTSSEAAFE